MFKRNYKRKIINYFAATLVGVSCFIPSAVSEAEMVNVEADGYYLLGDDDNISMAKNRARQDALRMAAEKAGVFITSYTKTKNLSLTDDEIIVISSNLLNVLKESVTNESVNGEGFKINCHIVACFDTDNLDTMKTLNTQTLAIKKKDDELEALNRENARLKMQLSDYNKARLRENEDSFKIRMYEREMIKAANGSNLVEADKWAYKIQEIDRDNAVCRNYLYKRIDPKSCIEECDKYLKSHPGDFVAEINRINALYSSEDKFPVNDKDKTEVNELVNKAKKILPQDAYYASISPTVVVKEGKKYVLKEGPTGITVDEQIYLLFERVYGVRISSFTAYDKNGKMKDDVILSYVQHPDDNDGKEVANIFSKYEKIYSTL